MNPSGRPAFGLYLHWPYCSRICPYCDFNVYRQRAQDSAPLVKAMIREIENGAACAPYSAETIFFGGGTPSLLEPRDLEALINAIDRTHGLSADCEITLECNPEDAERFAEFARAGVTRFSVGVQALNDQDLKALGRWHDAPTAIEAVETAARTGARMSLDLIYARSGQKLAAWVEELKTALALPAEHVSLYQLTIEPGTAFERAVKRGRLVMPENAAAAEFFEVTQAVCESAGAPAYEVSNHARGPHAWSRHNLLYWTSAQWLGIGPGAHGRFTRDGVRTATRGALTPNDYLQRVVETGVGWDVVEPLTLAEEGEEMLLTGLRTVLGVEVAAVEQKLGRALAFDAVAPALVEQKSGRAFATPQGRLVLNAVAATLLGL